MRTPTKLRRLAAASALLALGVSTGCSSNDPEDGVDAEAWCSMLEDAYDQFESTGEASPDLAARLRDDVPDEIDEEAFDTALGLEPSVADYDDPDEYTRVVDEYFAAEDQVSNEIESICSFYPPEAP